MFFKLQKFFINWKKFLYHLISLKLEIKNFFELKKSFQFFYIEKIIEIWK